MICNCRVKADVIFIAAFAAGEVFAFRGYNAVYGRYGIPLIISKIWYK